MGGKFIGTLAKEHGVNPRTLRFYEAERLLPRPRRTESGYRVYGDDAAQRLAFIAKAKGLGLSLREIRQILALRDTGVLPCDSVRQMFTDHLRWIDEQMARLQGFKSDLQMLLANCRHPRNSGGRTVARETICPAIETLAGNRR